MSTPDFLTQRKTLAAAAAVAILAMGGTASAHHGWGWTAPEECVFAGVVASAYYGNPHVQLQVVDAEGRMWRVDLSPPNQAYPAGFVSGTAEAGDRVVLIGHRSSSTAEFAFKAERVVVNGRVYDVYPTRQITIMPTPAMIDGTENPTLP